MNNDQKSHFIANSGFISHGNMTSRTKVVVTVARAGM